ncbi:uncharacterized protein LOC131605316 [Vicia villosa]|uniref:uncharacterized protein LOC131605316 n=1 Tax=Vicia villosa TaxID=3911 RepID=UPI00273BFB9C|nr:uncharacterized protein LOC131605316 [Vicia villosa]
MKVFGKFDLAVEEGVRIMNEGDEMVDDVDGEEIVVGEDELSRKRRAQSDFWLNLKIKENMLIQKSRLKWLNDGDSNSRYFHNVMNSRRIRNHIGFIVTDRGVVESVEEVKKETKLFFEEKFSEAMGGRPILEDISFSKLNRVERDGLEYPFSEEEIKEAIWSCDGARSPGPDGYSFRFIKKCWHFMKADFINCLSCFHREALLSKAITSSFLTLIPKNSNPLGLNEYRPICLVGCIYKVISKILASRLKKVLSSVVSECQSAFVPGRQLLDGVLVANEVIDLARKDGLGCLLFKVDFEKAYDNVSWDFLRFMLRKMGFGAKWLKWMEALIFESKMSVLVNGSPTAEFVVKKGLRQGHPLSPFLFVIVAEGLKGMVRKAVELGEYVGFNVRRKCSVELLQFADDTLLVGEGNWKQLWVIKAILRGFELVSGLGINYHKSNFLWGGVGEKRKVHWVNWKTICLPVEKGGLGIRRIKDFNIALLNKWRWRIFSGSEALWYKVLKARYGDINVKAASCVSSINGKDSHSKWWADILSLGISYVEDFFMDNCKFVLGDGYNISFWHSKWIGTRSLRELFPEEYACSNLKFVSVAGMGGWNSNGWAWDRFGLDAAGSVGADSMVQKISEMLQHVQPVSEARDGVIWLADPDFSFTVRSCYDLFNFYHLPRGPDLQLVSVFSLIWKLMIPIKIKFFGWRCLLDRLPTRDLLLYRGISISSPNVCVFCEMEKESLSHFIFSCRISRLVWKEIASWIGFSEFLFVDVWSSFYD